MTTKDDRVRIGTRKSPLAMWQAEYVRERLMAAHPGLGVELVPIETKGDKILDVALSKVGGKGLFVKELEVALLEGRVDLCVHSTKDMPAELPEGLGLVCFPPRADPRDALVMGGHGGLSRLPHGARVGTSSLRRQAQLLHLRPDLDIVSVRGNIQTRMKKVEELGLSCVVLACAGIDRMAAEENVGHRFSPDEMLPAAAQGILGIEARVKDVRVAALLAPLDDQDARDAVLAERAFLRALGGGCQVPIGAYCTKEGEALTLHGLVARPDGSVLVRAARRGTVRDPEGLGLALGEEVLGHGGRRILVELGLIGAHPHASSQQLEGVTVVVARDDAPDDNISLTVVAQGAELVPLNLMKLDAPEDGSALETALRELAGFDVLAFTSAAGVERFFSRLDAAWLDLRALKADVVIAAVGPKTEAALRAHRAHVDVVGDGGGVELAAALAAAMSLAGKRVLLPRAEGAREELKEILDRKGAEVVAVDAYRSVPCADAGAAVRAALDQARALGGRLALLLTSPRRVEVLLEALGDDRRALEGFSLLAIGQVTRQAMLDAGLPGVLAVEHPTPGGVVATLRALG